MTNSEILKIFHEKYSEIRVVDYRPLCPEMFTKNLIGITVWLENGDVIQYYQKEAQDELNAENDVVNKIIKELSDTGAYEKEVHGNTDFLKGISYCLGVIEKCKTESEE